MSLLLSVTEEKRKMNNSTYLSSGFTIENTSLTKNEKLIMVFLWVIIEVIGNGLLLGLIRFDWYGGDPLKRRIIDQVIIKNIFLEIFDEKGDV